MEPADVLVVGAGTTGLVAASELARHGVKVRVVDRSAVASDHTRALAIQSRTLEIFEDLGVLRDVMARGRRVQKVSLFEGKKGLLHLNLDDLDVPYPFILSLPQGETEAVLTAHLATLGVEIERGVQWEGVDQDDFGLTSTLVHSDGRVERFKSSWLVGCDGAQSVIRETLGVPFKGVDIDALFALVDVDIDGRLPSDTTLSFFSADGVVFFIPLPKEGRWRIMVDITELGAPARLDIAFFQHLVDERVKQPLKLSNPMWATPFAVRQRLAGRYRQGRAFLCGDAAHILSPAGGQGMGMGIQDAYNLGWKLALVIRGVGRPALLESYEPERRGAVEGVLRGAGQTTRLVRWRHPVSRELRNSVARFLGGFDAFQLRLATGLGEIGHRYDSPVIDEVRASLLEAQWFEDRSKETPTLADRRGFAAGPGAGARAPDGHLLSEGSLTRLHAELVGTTHTVLLFDGQAPTPSGYAVMASIARSVEERFGALVKACVVVPGREIPEGLAGVRVLMDPQGEVHNRYGAGAECLYVIRPDGYVGFRCQPIDSEILNGWLSKIFL